MSPRGRSAGTGPRGRPAGAPRSAGRPAATAAGSRPARAAPRLSRPGESDRARGGAGSTAAPQARSAQSKLPQSKLTGRAAVLVLVLAVLTVSYASSMRAYLQQRSSINELKSQITRNESDINALTSEKKQWSDPTYVQQQARARLGYVVPGETTYLVLGQDGKPLDVQASLDDPSTATATEPTAWWSDEWDSVELAGHPPKVTGQGPATKIDGAAKSAEGSAGRSATKSGG